MPELPRVLERLAAAGIRSWQLQLTVAMGRAVDEPDMLLQPYDLVALFPILGDLAHCASRGRRRYRGRQQRGVLRALRENLCGDAHAQGHSCGCGAGASTLGIEADGTIKGCPSLATREWAGGNIRDETRLARHLGARDAASLHARSHREGPLGVLRDVLLRRRVPCGMHVDRRTCCSAAPATTPTATIAQSQLDKQGLRERLVPVARRRQASHSTTECSISSSSLAPATPRRKNP